MTRLTSPTSRACLLELLLACAACVALAAAGCVGDPPAPRDPGEDPGEDPGQDPGGDPDPDPDPVAIDVSGIVWDYFAPTDVLAGANLTTDGIAPPVSATSDLVGAYTLANVPAASVFYVVGSMAEGYRVTTNESVTVVDQSIKADFYIVSEVDAQRQHATAGVEVLPATSIVIAHLRRADGTPLEGIPRADVTLLDALGQPAGDGPYFFGELGDVDPLLEVSTAYEGRARVAFLNVPTGTFTLTVLEPPAAEGGQPITHEVSLITRDLGASLVSIGALPPEPPPPPQQGKLRFSVDVYPLLQKASQGGQGCANCHSVGKAGGFLPFDGTPDVVLSAIRARPGCIDVASPPDSMLLTKPLYEEIPNHPNATWLTTLDPAYVTVYTWIEQGASP